MDFLIRFVQVHESFRRPEIQALAVLANVNVEFLSYSENVRLDIFWPKSFVICRNFIRSTDGDSQYLIYTVSVLNSPS